MNIKHINTIICHDSISFFKKNIIENVSLVITSPSYYSSELSRIRKFNEISGGVSKDKYIDMIYELFLNISKGFNENTTIIIILGTYGSPVETLILMLENSFKKMNLNLIGYKLFSLNNSESVVAFSKRNTSISIPNFEFLQEYKDVGRYGTINTNIIKWAIENFSNENELVIDPFVGTGGVVKMAKKMNRNYFGVDIDCEAIEIANKENKTIP